MVRPSSSASLRVRALVVLNYKPLSLHSGWSMNTNVEAVELGRRREEALLKTSVLWSLSSLQIASMAT